jgi:hypothetical protein
LGDAGLEFDVFRQIAEQFDETVFGADQCSLRAGL